MKNSSIDLESWLEETKNPDTIKGLFAHVMGYSIDLDKVSISENHILYEEEHIANYRVNKDTGAITFESAKKQESNKPEVSNHKQTFRKGRNTENN